MPYQTSARSLYIGRSLPHGSVSKPNSPRRQASEDDQPKPPKPAKSPRIPTITARKTRSIVVTLVSLRPAAVRLSPTRPTRWPAQHRAGRTRQTRKPTPASRLPWSCGQANPVVRYRACESSRGSQADWSSFCASWCSALARHWRGARTSAWIANHGGVLPRTRTCTQPAPGTCTNGIRQATAGLVDLSSELADHYRVKSLLMITFAEGQGNRPRLLRSPPGSIRGVAHGRVKSHQTEEERE